MPLELDQILGVLYLAPDEFTARARTFGTDISGLDAEDIKTALALASRAVEAELGGRTFIPETIVEQHRWQPQTRRVSVNSPPVMTLESIEILYAPGARYTLSPSDVVVNNQENYLEAASLALVAGLETAFESLGLSEAIVEVSYKSYQTIPGAVAAAVGFTAARFLQEAEANDMLPAGLKRSKVGSEDLSRSDEQIDIPVRAKQLLRPLQRISIA